MKGILIIIKEAAKLGEVTVGVLCTCKHYHRCVSKLNPLSALEWKNESIINRKRRDANQAGVQHFISYLTDTKPCPLWHWNQGLFDVRVNGGTEYWAVLIVVSPLVHGHCFYSILGLLTFFSFAISLINMPNLTNLNTVFFNISSMYLSLE